MGRKGYVIALALAPLVYLVFVKPLLISEEARIRKGIREGVQAIEARDLGKCLRHVSLNYRDEYGLTYLGVQRLLTHIFQEFSAFEIDLRELRVTVLEKEAASATFNLKIRASYRGQRVYVLGSEDFSNRATLSFIKEGGRWKVTQVEGIETRGIGQDLPRVVRRWVDTTVCGVARVCQREA